MSTNNMNPSPWWKSWWTTWGIGAAIGTAAVEAVGNWINKTSVLGWLWQVLVALSGWLEQEIPMPLWLLLGVTVTVLGVIAMLVYMLIHVRGLEHEIDQLKNPPTVPLTDFQHSVLMTIAGFLDNDIFPTERHVRNHLVVTAIPVHAALDVLTERHLVSDEMLTDGSSFIDLTANGRKYVLDPENYSRPSMAP